MKETKQQSIFCGSQHDNILAAWRDVVADAVSDNVFLEVQQGVTSGSAKAKLEIELTPSLSAETQIGQQGTGSSLGWTYDY